MSGAALFCAVGGSGIGEFIANAFGEFGLACPVNEVAFEDIFGDESKLAYGFVVEGDKVDELTVFFEDMVGVEVVNDAVAASIAVAETGQPVPFGECFAVAAGESTKDRRRLEAETFKTDVGNIYGVAVEVQLLRWVVEGLTVGERGAEEEAEGECLILSFSVAIGEWGVKHEATMA